LNTGQSVVRGLLGTAAGFIVGAALVALIGTNTTLLWFLLPAAVLLAGLAPAVVSFAAGQAAFTLTLLILFNILQPEGWRIGLVRIEDVALGFAASLLVGLLFWPRGAAAVLDLWQRDDPGSGDHAAVRGELLASAELVGGWYRGFAAGLVGRAPVPDPLPRDEQAEARLVDAVSRDLLTGDRRADATGVRM